MLEAHEFPDHSRNPDAAPARTYGGSSLTGARADEQGSELARGEMRPLQDAWSEVLTRRGRQGLGPDFIRSHEAFLESGCTARADVCPRSADEMDTANMLTIAAMNAGMASTFLPFACRK
jgi:hypothetical protein